jgi:hypothetical protein
MVVANGDRSGQCGRRKSASGGMSECRSSLGMCKRSERNTLEGFWFD